MTAVLPDHTHDTAEYPVAAQCPRCMALGTVNPDTGSRYPTLTDADADLLAQMEERFADRLDGPDYGPALRSVLEELLHRAKMRGRFAEVAEMRAHAVRHEARMMELTKQAHDLAGDDPSDTAVRRSLALALEHADAAATLHARAGSR